MKLARRAGLALLITASIGVGFYAAQLRPANTVIFTGSVSHDFGTILFRRDEPATVRHTFELANESSRAIVIDDVTSSCGCAGATVDKRTIPPGDTLTVRAVVEISHPGRLQESIWLELKDHPTVKLQVVANARPNSDFYAIERSVWARTGGTVQATVVRLIDTDNEPGVITWTAPDGVTAVFKGWERIYARDKDDRPVSRWHGHIEFSVSDTAQIKLDSAVQFDLEGARTEINLSGRPW